MSATYTIGTLAGMTGLSAHTIRAWERRYSALSPDRSATNRRVYTDADAHRLGLLKRAVEGGHSIGQVANLPNERLETLEIAGRARPPSMGQDESSEFLALCLDAVSRLSPEQLEQALIRANAALGTMGLLNGVAIPLLGAIEGGWLDGSIRIAQEHMASAVLRAYLQSLRASMPGTRSSPRLLVTTPRNQHHEFGALMVSIVAAMESWSVTYLGANLPVEEIADAVRLSSARAVALSLVYPVDDAGLGPDLRGLRSEVGPRFPILVGGRASTHYADVLEEIGARVCLDLGEFRRALEDVVPGHSARG